MPLPSWSLARTMEATKLTLATEIRDSRSEFVVDEEDDDVAGGRGADRTDSKIWRARVNS